MTSALLALVLLAQTITVTIPPNTEYTVAWQHDGLLMPEFRWWCDGEIVKNFPLLMPVPLTPDADGLYTYTALVPGMPEGVHMCFISAYNQHGEVKAPPVPIVVGTPQPPAMPFNIRVVVTVKGGGE